MVMKDSQNCPTGCRGGIEIYNDLASAYRVSSKESYGARHHYDGRSLSSKGREKRYIMGSHSS